MRFVHDLKASPAILTTTLILMAGTSFAADPPYECTTNRGTWNVVASIPRIVECPEGGECTQIDYSVTKAASAQAYSNHTYTYSYKPDYVAVIAEYDMTVVVPSAAYVARPCKGDAITALGQKDCSSQGVRLLKNESSGLFELAVTGGRAPIAGSIAVKKGSSIEYCLIASLGRDTFDPNAQVSTAQQFVFKGCTVTIPTDQTTGEGSLASIAGPDCVFAANAEPVSNGELLINGQSVGTLNYGEGSVSSGIASCTTRVIKRKLYSWCTCADVTGDGVPDDPRPPCPNTTSGSLRTGR